MRAATLRRTATGWTCIADHVLIWCPPCAICGSPISTARRVAKAAESQGGDAQKVWLICLGSGVKVDSGKRERWYGRLCKGCDSQPD